ncbi:hypothetical protein Ahy_A01g001322 [Arachis hypogaea]|uniref:Uncharacterized protein n=1 Tax=Arachis hypogaea TaxID=3818 RepID=A0A445EMS3_ARAHY|nr:hypothetical protein Ahy_A01g001322 [Arachis hypogaea]
MEDNGRKRLREKIKMFSFLLFRSSLFCIPANSSAIRWFSASRAAFATNKSALVGLFEGVVERREVDRPTVSANVRARFVRVNLGFSQDYWVVTFPAPAWPCLPPGHLECDCHQALRREVVSPGSLPALLLRRISSRMSTIFSFSCLTRSINDLSLSVGTRGPKPRLSTPSKLPSYRFPPPPPPPPLLSACSSSSSDIVAPVPSPGDTPAPCSYTFRVPSN